LHERLKITENVVKAFCVGTIQHSAFRTGGGAN